MYCNKINICIPWKHSLTYRLWHKLKNQMVVVIKWALYVSINIADVQNHYNLNKEWHAHHHSTYIHTDMEATYFWDYAFLPFSLWEWFNALPNGWGVCRPGLLDIVTKKKGVWKKEKGGSMSPPVVGLSHCMVSHIQQPHRSCFMCSR